MPLPVLTHPAPLHSPRTWLCWQPVSPFPSSGSPREDSPLPGQVEFLVTPLWGVMENGSYANRKRRVGWELQTLFM
jgi:hypothetical protein